MRALRFLFMAAAGIVMVAGAAKAGTTTCDIPTSCAVVQNTGSGPAIHAQGASGYGVRSTSLTGTAVYGASSSGNAFIAGIVGESTNANGSDAAAAFGVGGAMAGTPAEYGAIGYGLQFGLSGTVVNSGTTSPGGYGVYGEDDATSKSDYNVGVAGSSSYGTGMLAQSNGTPSLDFMGLYPIGMYGVANSIKENLPAFGVVGEGNDIPIEAFNTAKSTHVQLAGPADLILAGSSTAGNGSFTVSNAGNAQLSGSLTTSGGTYVRTQGASGATMIAYGARTASPEIDDVGQAQLVSGRGMVRIDEKLGDVLDRRANYLVFLTPEGDCNGLFVSQKSAGGFVVRELRSGRSSLTFDYRIVAKPRDESGERLAIAPVLHQTDALSSNLRAHARTRALSPVQMLQKKLGPAGFDRAVKHLLDLEAAK